MYTRSISGMQISTSTPHTAMPSSRNAYTRSGLCRMAFSRGSPTLPMHSPPMYAASRNPIDTEVEPMASCRN